VKVFGKMRHNRLPVVIPCLGRTTSCQSGHGTIFLFLFIAVCSGVAALVFETLWFRVAGLAFGNTIWASSIVVSSFMGGLGIGNLFIMRSRHSISPLRLYAALETIIAFSGFALVLLFPRMAQLMAPLARVFVDDGWVLHALRAVFAFLLLLIPTTAMGATLPLLVEAISRRESAPFGRTLGRLYGWNTFGAMIGALIGELVLIKWLGVWGAACCAAVAGLSAAAMALGLTSRTPSGDADRRKTEDSSKIKSVYAGHGWLLAAAFLSGLFMITLEIVWFRFLLLFFPSSALIFSIMLAVVLLGISAGGIVAAFWFRKEKTGSAKLLLSLLAAAAGLSIVVTYSTFNAGVEVLRDAPDILKAVGLSLFLMLPASIASGAFFTVLGHALHQEQGREIRTVGLLAAANTFGGMCGGLLAGFYLIPRWGMERSYFLLVSGYGIVALVIAMHNRKKRSESYRFVPTGVIIAFCAILAFFPFGIMQRVYLAAPRAYFEATEPHTNVVAIREGRTETIQYLQTTLLNESYLYRLLTNSHSMSSTGIRARRFKKLFVYLPLSVKPRIGNALLICYGAGVTAKAMTETGDIESIDIVDISRDIFDMSSVIYSYRENPLNDPRVTIHIEDGRQFLQVTDKRYDLITAEPPPPRAEGVANLYTQEYFQLLHDHLNDGGLATYWLPVNQLSETQQKAVVKAFCGVFNDCSLWSASGLEFMMVGSRGLTTAPTEAEFTRLWRVPKLQGELTTLGIERPEQLGLLVIADHTDLAAWTKGSLPLTDNFPMRLTTEGLGEPIAKIESSRWFKLLSSPVQKRRFEVIARLWPERIQERMGRYRAVQRVINELLLFDDHTSSFLLDDLETVLMDTDVRFPIMFLLGSDDDVQRIVDTASGKGIVDSMMPYQLAVRSLADRDYKSAEHYFALSQTMPHPRRELEDIYYIRIYLLSRMARNAEAKMLLREFINMIDQGRVSASPAFWEWVKRQRGLSLSSPRI